MLGLLCVLEHLTRLGKAESIADIEESATAAHDALSSLRYDKLRELGLQADVHAHSRDRRDGVVSASPTDEKNTT